jgi:pyruvate formate lyase activating enzyme
VRVPVIPGLNDDEANILATARFCMENNISKINLLPYHNLGLVKYEQLGVEYGLKEIIPPEASRIELLKDLVQSVGVECVVG